MITKLFIFLTIVGLGIPYMVIIQPSAAVISGLAWALGVFVCASWLILAYKTPLKKMPK